MRTAPPLSNLSLYLTYTCPYCVRVLHALDRMGIELTLRDLHRDPEARRELIAGGGKGQVPCLRIDETESGGGVRWMYESEDIVDFIRDHYAS